MENREYINKLFSSMEDFITITKEDNPSEEKMNYLERYFANKKAFLKLG